MEVQMLKLEVIELLLRTNEVTILNKIKQELVNQVPDLMESKKTTIIGRTPSGDPLTEEAYLQQIENSRKEMIKGDVIDLEELEREAENW